MTIVEEVEGKLVDVTTRGDWGGVPGPVLFKIKICNDARFSDARKRWVSGVSARMMEKMLLLKNTHSLFASCRLGQQREQPLDQQNNQS